MWNVDIHRSAERLDARKNLDEIGDRRLSSDNAGIQGTQRTDEGKGSVHGALIS